jgi:diguanylate cyclase (GGDEF)-like protein
MNATPDQPVDARGHTSGGVAGKTAKKNAIPGARISVATGDSLECALVQELPTDGTLVILPINTDGTVAYQKLPTKSIAILSMVDGFPLSPSDHPLVRIRNGETLNNCTYRLFNDAGESRTIQLTSRTSNEARFLIASDITAATVRNAKLEMQAETDEFTGAVNYRGLIDRLNASLHRARPANDRLAVLALSLDGFRVLSESLASDVEPLVIREVAKRLKAVTREDELVAYLGGDRFIVLIHQVANEPDAVAAAERIRRAVNSPMKFGRREIRVSVSIGVAFNGRRSEDAKEILRNATVASQAARSQGENDWAVFDEAMRSRTLNNMRAEDMVDDALRTDAFAAQFQPIVTAKNRGITGFETLARIRSTDGLNFPPTSFVEAAERSGRITPLDRRILDLACDQAKRFDERSPGTYRISVNLSTHTALRPDLYSIVSDAIEEHRLSPKLFALEFREDAFLEAGTATKAAFSELEHDGIAIALDAFGQGQVGIHHLANFPVTTVKLHMTYVQGVTTSAGDRAAIQGITATAHALGIGVTATGVETTEQAAILTDLGCDHLQGFFLGRPMTGHDAEALLFT